MCKIIIAHKRVNQKKVAAKEMSGVGGASSETRCDWSAE